MPNPNAAATASAGLILGIFILLVTIGMVVWLRRARSARVGFAEILTQDDRKYFLYQDIRRTTVIVILALLAIALIFGTRIPYKVGERPNPLFVQIWTGAIGLLMALVVLSSLDWAATRVYAKRRRLELIEQGVALIEKETKARNDRTGLNGRH